MDGSEGVAIYEWPDGSLMAHTDGSSVVLQEGEQYTKILAGITTNVAFDEHGDMYPGDQQRGASVTATDTSARWIFSDGEVVTDHLEEESGLVVRTLLSDEGVTTFPGRLVDADEGWEVSSTAIVYNGQRIASKWGEGWTRHVDAHDWLSMRSQLKLLFPDFPQDAEGIPCPN